MTFKTKVLSVEDNRIDAIEHALRVAKAESEETGEPYDSGVAHEKDLLTGTEHIYYLFECGHKRWRVVRASPNTHEITQEELKEVRDRAADGVTIDVPGEILSDDDLEELREDQPDTVYEIRDKNTAPEEVETEPPEDDLLDPDLTDETGDGKREEGKVPLPDCDAATAGWPDEDEPEYDLDDDDEWKVPYPDDAAGKTEEVWEEPYPHGMDDKGKHGWLVKYHKTPTTYETVASVENEIDALEHALRNARKHSREVGEPVEVLDVRSVHERTGREYEFEEVVCGDEEWIIVPAPPENDD